MSARVATAPVVIIGAGCIGSAIAYHLGRLGIRGAVVLEKEPFAGAGSTSKAAGGVRAQFSSPINVRLSMLSIAHYARFAEEMGTGPVFFQVGYLFLLSDPACWASFQRQAEMQRGMGLDVRTLTAAQARELVPPLDVGDVLGATFCPQDGLVSPHEVTQGYVARARALGADFRFGCPAEGLDLSGRRVTGVRTASGVIACAAVVNGAGPPAAGGARLGGGGCSVAALRHQGRVGRAGARGGSRGPPRARARGRRDLRRLGRALRDHPGPQRGDRSAAGGGGTVARQRVQRSRRDARPRGRATGGGGDPGRATAGRAAAC